ncbi:MAG: PfkB family carbohydrate kinase [Trueperaceae bacterium]
MTTTQAYDVITLGETLLRLSPPTLQRLEGVHNLELHVGGSEANTAVGLARLGLRVAWLSRLTANALGQTIARTLTSHGVDTSHITWTQHDRVGLYFLEEAKAPRPSQVIYDRKDSAMSNIQPSDLPKDLFQSNRAKLFHTTGITLALSQSAKATALQALELAKAAGWKLSFDLNYRAKLWTLEEALQSCQPFLETVQLIFLPLRDAKFLFKLGQETPPDTVINYVGERYQNATIVMTMSAKGSMALHHGNLYEGAAFKAEEVGRLGGGDAFAAGFLYAYSTTQDIQESLRWGNAVAALKYSILGDLPLIEKREVEALLGQNQNTGIVR